MRSAKHSGTNSKLTTSSVPSTRTRIKRGSKSGGTSPVTSPVQKNHNKSVTIDVTNIKPTKNAKSFETVEANCPKELCCPCGSTHQKGETPTICCSACKRHWHTSCCNLNGVTPSVTQELEAQCWECPWCFTPAFPSPKTTDSLAGSNNDTFEKFLSIMTRVKECEEELNDGISSIEFFNLHIKHLLPDQTEDHSADFEKLAQDMAEVEERLSLINKVCATSPEIQKESEEQVEGNSIEKINIIDDSLTKPSDEFAALLPDQNTSNKIENNSTTDPQPPSELKTNTVHVRPRKPPCDPFVKYEKDIIPEDLHNSLKSFISGRKNDFVNNGGCRDSMFFGEFGYEYNGGKYDAKDMPTVVMDLLNHIKPLSSNLDGKLNSCLITRYKSETDHIPPHRDDGPLVEPDSEIITVSIGASRVMTFTDNLDSNPESLILENKSVLVTSKRAQYFWKHCIEKSENPCEETISFTFRHIVQHILNSTVILGDSNTKLLHFNLKYGLRSGLENKNLILY